MYFDQRTHAYACVCMVENDKNILFSSFSNLFCCFQPCKRMHKHVFAGRNTQHWCSTTSISRFPSWIWDTKYLIHKYTLMRFILNWDWVEKYNFTKIFLKDDGSNFDQYKRWHILSILRTPISTTYEEYGTLSLNII